MDNLENQQFDYIVVGGGAAGCVLAGRLSEKPQNRVLLVEESKPFCGVDAQIAFIIQDQAFDHLDAPIKRVSAVDVPQAYSKALENVQIPDHNRVLAKAMELI